MLQVLCNISDPFPSLPKTPPDASAITLLFPRAAPQWQSISPTMRKHSWLFLVVLTCCICTTVLFLLPTARILILVLQSLLRTGDAYSRGAGTVSASFWAKILNSNTTTPKKPVWCRYFSYLLFSPFYTASGHSWASAAIAFPTSYSPTKCIFLPKLYFAHALPEEI